MLMIASVELSPKANDLREQYTELVKAQDTVDGLDVSVLGHDTPDSVIASAAHVLAIAFDKDPVFAYLRGGDKSPLNPVFDFILRESIDHGGTPVIAQNPDKEVVGVIDMQLPGMKPESPLYSIRYGAPSAIGVFGLMGAIKSAYGLSGVERSVEKQKSNVGVSDAMYLNYVGILQPFRGKSVIHALADPGLKVADQYGFHAFLASSNDRVNGASFGKAGYVNPNRHRYLHGLGPDVIVRHRPPQTT